MVALELLLVASIAAGEPVVEPRAATLGGLTAWVVPNRCADDGRVLVALHGYGTTRKRVAKLARDYARRHCAALVFPEAPVALRGGRRVWWRAPASAWLLPAVTWEDPPPGMASARDAVLHLLAALEQETGLTGDHLVLAGFSQGATLALEVAAHRPVAGLLLVGGRFVATAPEPRDWSALAGGRAVIAHGLLDRISPHWAAATLGSELERIGTEVTWLTYSGGHRPPLAVTRRFHAALAKVLRT
jgi:phospholipase/carboxylesterase